MSPDVTDRDTVARLVRHCRARLTAGEHDASAAHAARALGIATDRDHAAAMRLAGLLPEDGLGPATADDPQQPFFSRDPLVRVLQSSADATLRRHGLATAPAAAEHHNGPLAGLLRWIEGTFEDGYIDERSVRFASEFVEGALQRLMDGTHPFNAQPAELELELGEQARMVLVGDWGSGLAGAGAVAELMAEEVRDGVAHGREVHVVHLGDVYFAGQADEYRRNVLADGFWPVSAAQSDVGVGSWSLAGNHDIYGGTRAYFTVLLGDPRFKRQRSADGQPTSWFRLTAPHCLICLDSAWNDDPLA